MGLRAYIKRHRKTMSGLDCPFDSPGQSQPQKWIYCHQIGLGHIYKHLGC
ncbi:mCG148004 [Mus musculus]|nr:mCG148004 [Mus musculus]